MELGCRRQVYKDFRTDDGVETAMRRAGFEHFCREHRIPFESVAPGNFSMEDLFG